MTLGDSLLETLATGLEPVSHASSQLPQNDDELYELVYAVTGLRFARQAVCEDHVAPFQAMADAYFARTPMLVWHASRGLGGKSLMLAALAQVEALTLGATVNLLGGSGEQSAQVHKYMTGDDTNLPNTFWQFPGMPHEYALLKPDDFSKRETRLSNGAVIRVLMASQTSVRGPHPARLRLDECFLGGTLVATPTGQRRIDHIMAGDIVIGYTNSGTLSHCVVESSMCRGERDTLIITLEDGREIVCTKNHKLLTQAGWLKAEEITEAHSLYTVQQEIFNQGALEQPHRAVLGLLPRQNQETSASLSSMWIGKAGPVRDALRVLHAFTQAQCAKVRGMRDAVETARDRALQEMLSQISLSVWYDRAHGGWQSYCAQGWAPLQTGNSVCGVVDGAWYQLSRASSARPSDCGFCVRDSGHRSTRRLLARSAGSLRARYEEENGAGSTRVHGAFSKIEPVASLVAVASISAGPSVPVFDIKVADTHNFIANGVIAHNCDEMDIEILDAALGQPMTQRGVELQVVMSSTHHNPDGTMTEILRRAAQKSWPVLRWCYRENLTENGGWLSERMVETKRELVTEETWQNEFELQEPNPEERALDALHVERMFDSTFGVFKGDADEYIELEAPVDGARYSTGADWAKSKDWTIIWTLRVDVKPYRTVAWRRTGRRSWTEMVKLFDEQAKRFYGAAGYDHTGVGAVVEDLTTLYRPRGYDLQGNTRRILLTQYLKAVEKGEILAPRIEYAYNEHKRMTSNDLWGSGHLPDSVCAGAIAYALRGGRGWSKGPAA